MIRPRSFMRVDAEGVPTFIQEVRYRYRDMMIEVALFNGVRLAFCVELFSFYAMVGLKDSQPPPGWQDDAMAEAGKYISPEQWLDETSTTA